MQKTVLITGASRGIGAATARLFAQRGYAVGINYRQNIEAARQVEADILALKGSCMLLPADVSVEQDVEQMFTHFEQRFGTLDVLVNNAGIIKPQSRLIDLDASRINQLLQTNVTSAFLCAKQAVLRMSKARGGKGGSIINVSSAASRTGSPHEYIDYAATKGAIDTMTRGLAMEVANEGIRVNCVRPGLIYTDMHADGGEPQRVDRVSPGLPMQRGGQPQEIAEAIYWLASEQASYATANFLDLAGGL